jgi:hypothetical protein
VNVLLLQLDGKLPNIALMRIASHHRARGDTVLLRRIGSLKYFQNDLFESWDQVYASLIFSRSRPLAEHLRSVYPGIILGGTGWDATVTLESYGIITLQQDYTDYPRYRQSLGFTQRGCRLRCSFCLVPKAEGTIREEQSITDIWRGEPWPRELLLLDNDFFGQPHWRERIDEIQTGRFKVSFNQGINARMLTDETAAALASVDYRDDTMKAKRLFCAWDNRKDEQRLFAGLELLTKHGVKPYNILVYMLCGYWPGETMEDCNYRRAKLREFGAIPYPMPYVRTRELVGFQRWVVGYYDKRTTWAQWVAAGYVPYKLHLGESTLRDDEAVNLDAARRAGVLGGDPNADHC